MGRGKLALEYISKDRSRKTTFEKRKKGLMKKAEEFSILCGVDTAVIVYNGDDPKCSEPATWPQDPARVGHVIKRYLSEGVERRNRRAMSLPDFFINRKRKLDNELARVRSANLEAKYHVSDELLDGFSHDQLPMLISILGMKLKGAKSLLRAAKESAALNMSGMVPMQMDDFGFSSSAHPLINDYLQMKLKHSFNFHQPLMTGPYLPPMMNSNSAMSGSWPMMLPHNGESSSGSTTSNGNGIHQNNHFGNHQNNNLGNQYIYFPPVPSYNNSFNHQSQPLLTHHNMTMPRDQYNHVQEPLPLPDNSMLDNASHTFNVQDPLLRLLENSVLDNASDTFNMMMMMPSSQEPNPIIQHHNPTPSTLQVAEYHNNDIKGNSYGYNQIFHPNSGSS